MLALFSARWCEMPQLPLEGHPPRFKRCDFTPFLLYFINLVHISESYISYITVGRWHLGCHCPSHC